MSKLTKLFREELKDREVAFVYLGYSGIVLRVKEYTLVFDAGDLLEEEDIMDMQRPVIAMYTHNHSDHFHTRVAMKLYDLKGAIIITNDEVFKDLETFLPSTNLRLLAPRKGVRLGNARIFAIEGKHIVPTNVYYVIMDNLRIFHGGSSGYINLSKLNADIAFLPVGYPSADASPESAAQIAIDLNVKYAVAIHGNEEQKELFKEILKNKKPEIDVLIPKEEELVKISL